MAFTPKPGEQYTIRRKILAILGAKFHVYDENQQVVAFCKQKAFKLREDIRIYTSEDMSELLYALQARQIIDFGATYDVTLPSGERVGSFRRKGMKSSFLRDEWTVYDAEENQVAILRELGAVAPFARRYLDAASVFLPQRYAMIRLADSTEIARFRQHFNPVVYRLGVSVQAPDDHLDELMLLAAGTLIAAIEGRQN